MPRIARKDLNTSFFHVMVQGVNKEFIFNEDTFLRKYLYGIKQNIIPNQYELLAYCMMNNHAHFLFCVHNLVAFEKYMHKNNQLFAQLYNFKNQRCGVVFRNRYQIEPIYDVNHLKNCIKYIHNNPVKAGMVKSCNEYRYSSYQEFKQKTGVANNDILKDIFGKDCDYLALFEDAYERRFLDIDDQNEIHEYVNAGIKEFLKRTNSNLIQIYSERTTLRKLVLFLKEECNLQYKEVREYLQIPRGVINRMVK